MADQASADLREDVRSRYAEAARAFRDPAVGGRPRGYGGCCGGSPAESCCAAAGFTDASVAFTHGAALGMHSAIIRATKPHERRYRPAAGSRIDRRLAG